MCFRIMLFFKVGFSLFMSFSPASDDSSWKTSTLIVCGLAGVAIVGAVGWFVFVWQSEEFSPDNPLKDSPEDTTKKFFQATK
jgi:hypothetical protein